MSLKACVLLDNMLHVVVVSLAVAGVCVYALNLLVSLTHCQWRNTHWTWLDKCQGPPGSRGPQA